jgi:hypothetical protein
MKAVNAMMNLWQRMTATDTAGIKKKVLTIASLRQSLKSSLIDLRSNH